MIPEHRLSELTQRMLNLFEQGGMMGIEKVSLHGQSISLLCLVETDREENVVLNYNYFDDDCEKIYTS